MVENQKADIEIWKSCVVKGICVSNFGRVRRDSDGYIYKVSKNKSNGYNYVDLRREEGGKNMKVARLVAMAFIPNIENKTDVDHINTIRTDDRVENLRWCTRSENMHNEITWGKIKNKPFKERPKRRVPILQYDKNGVFIKEWDSATAFGRTINKDVSGNIIACIKGKQPTAYGYKWKYKYDRD